MLDIVDHSVQTVEDTVNGKAQYGVPECFEVLIPFGIVLALLLVNLAVDFDD